MYLTTVYHLTIPLRLRLFDPEHLSHVALRSAIIFTKFEVSLTRSTYPFLTNNVVTADTLGHAVTLTLDSLAVKSFVVHFYRLSCDRTVPNSSETERTAADL